MPRGEVEGLGPAGDGEPDGFAGEPEGDVGAGGDRGGGDGDGLVGALGFLGACGQLDHQRAGHHATVAEASAGASPRLADVLHVIFTTLLILVCVFMAWFSAFVVYRLYRGRNAS